MAAAPVRSLDSIGEAVRRYEAHGFRSAFTVRDAGRVQCLSCQSVLAPQRVRMRALHRLEGESDPSDESAVVAIECGSCSARGTLVLAFGPEASLEDKLAFSGFEDQRGKDATLPSGM